MCDYCDCRSYPQIAALSAEHEALLSLVVDLRRATAAAAGDRAGPALARLRDLLEDHAAREERGVFHQLRVAGVDAAYVAMFEQDHQRIHALLDDTAGPTWSSAATELADLLTDHIAREETDLFPAAHQLLTPSQWDAVEAAAVAAVDAR